MESIDIKLIQSDQTVDPKVLEVYEFLKIFKDAPARGEWLERYGKAWDTIENKMWEGDEESEMRKQGSEPFVTNKCVKGVQGSCAIVTDQKPEAKFLPIGSGDLYVAELMKRGFDVVWTKNEGNDTIYEMYEEVEVGAHGFISAEFDRSMGLFGSIVFNEEPPDDLYWDASSRRRDYSDTHLIKAKQRNLQFIRERYPGIKDKDLYFIPVTVDDDSKSEGITTGDNYAELDGAPDHVDPQIKSQQKIIWEIDAWMNKVVVDDYIVEFGEDGKEKLTKVDIGDQDPDEFAKTLKEGQEHLPMMRKQRVQRIIVGKKLISEKINPEGTDSDYQPLMTIIGMKGQKTRTAYAMSKTNYARDINREKNKRRIQTIHAASHLINAPLWYTDDVTWTGNPGTPGSRAKVSGSAQVPPIGRVSSGALDVMQLVRLEEKADAEIDEMYDHHDVMKGKIPKGQDNIAGRTVLALQDMAGVMSKPSVRKVESAIVRLAKVLMAMMLKHWPREMWDRLLEDEEKIGFAPEGTDENKEMSDIQEGQADIKEEIKLNKKIAAKWEEALEKIRPMDPDKPPGLSLIDVDVAVVAGSSMPTNRIAKGAMAIDYVKAGIYDAEAALEYVDDPNRDKIVERHKKRQEAELRAGISKK